MKLIPISHGQNAIVDDDIYELVKDYRWYTTVLIENSEVVGYNYVCSKINGKFIGLHIFIMGKQPKGYVIDHKNRNRLDNRRENLRIASYSQNAANSTITKRWRTNKTYKGVYTSTNGKHFVTLQHNKSVYKSGPFDDIREAAKDYNKKALEVWGEFAVLNEIK